MLARIPWVAQRTKPLRPADGRWDHMRSVPGPPPAQGDRPMQRRQRDGRDRPRLQVRHRAAEQRGIRHRPAREVDGPAHVVHPGGQPGGAPPPDAVGPHTHERGVEGLQRSESGLGGHAHGDERAASSMWCAPSGRGRYRREPSAPSPGPAGRGCWPSATRSCATRASDPTPWIWRCSPWGASPPTACRRSAPTGGPPWQPTRPPRGRPGTMPAPI